MLASPGGYLPGASPRLRCQPDRLSVQSQQVFPRFVARRTFGELAPSAQVSAHLAAARTIGCRARRITPAVLEFGSLLIHPPRSRYPSRVSVLTPRAQITNALGDGETARVFRSEAMTAAESGLRHGPLSAIDQTIRGRRANFWLGRRRTASEPSALRTSMRPMGSLRTWCPQAFPDSCVILRHVS